MGDQPIDQSEVFELFSDLGIEMDAELDYRQLANGSKSLTNHQEGVRRRRILDIDAHIQQRQGLVNRLRCRVVKGGGLGE